MDFIALLQKKLSKEEDPGSDLFIDICRVRLAMVTVVPAGRCSILSLSVEGKRGHY
jgi:hypothetical protein